MANARHDYRRCIDADCPSRLCIAYKDGYQDGVDDAMSAGDDD